jgi:hypothetical protein
MFFETLVEGFKFAAIETLFKAGSVATYTLKEPKLNSNIILINRDGAIEILIKTRKLLSPDVLHIFKEFGIDTTNRKCLTKEQQTLSAIGNAFKIEKIEDDRPIYRVHGFGEDQPPQKRHPIIGNEKCRTSKHTKLMDLVWSWIVNWKHYCIRERESNNSGGHVNSRFKKERIVKLGKAAYAGLLNDLVFVIL